MLKVVLFWLSVALILAGIARMGWAGALSHYLDVGALLALAFASIIVLVAAFSRDRGRR